MDADRYFEEIARIRKMIKIAGEQELEKLQLDLDRLSEVKPWRLCYIFALAELMLKQGENPEKVRLLLETTDQEMFNHSGLVERFKLTKSTWPQNDLGQKQCDFLMHLYGDEKVEDNYLAQEELEIELLSNDFENNSLKKLAEQYYITRNVNLYVILMLLWGKQEGKLLDYTSYIRKDVQLLPNIIFLFDRLISEEAFTFIIVDSANESKINQCTILAGALKRLGKRSFVVQEPIQCTINETVDAFATVEISIENIEMKNEIYYVRPIELIKNGQSLGDNRTELISYITENFGMNNLSLVLTQEKTIDDLHKNKKFAKNFQRLSECQSDALKENMAFAWTGDYLSYVSYLYGFDAHEKITAPAECEFSIVVPAKNSAKTLRYTLQTCLEQNFKGNYEIVLSDNSAPDSMEIYDLYCELNNSHIKYYKTPHELNLSKSFEFAFLQAKGNFIFSIGSDDGVFPWTLQILHEIITKMPEDYDILKWRRGLYAWPGFNEGQENQCVIPLSCTKNNIEMEGILSESLMQAVIDNPKGSLYGLPLLYINSGFYRRYLPKVLAQTGRLWDGISQDIYMGLTNIACNKDIMTTSYLLSIAGLSNMSIGRLSSEFNNTLEKTISFMSAMKIERNLSAYIWNREEYIFPEFANTDLLNVFGGLLRLISIGALPKDYIQKINWIELYKWLGNTLSLSDVCFERKMGLLCYAAKQVSPAVFSFVEKELCPSLVVSKTIAEETLNKQKLYSVGPAGDSIILDGKDFSVTNIYDAVQLFAKITGL